MMMVTPRIIIQEEEEEKLGIETHRKQRRGYQTPICTVSNSSLRAAAGFIPPDLRRLSSSDGPHPLAAFAMAATMVASSSNCDSAARNMSRYKIWLVTGALLGCLAVAFGAFGAHGLESAFKILRLYNSLMSSRLPRSWPIGRRPPVIRCIMRWPCSASAS